MTYCRINFKTKIELKRALAAGEKIGIFEPGPVPAVRDGQVWLEGPHWPRPHRWYGQATMKDGIIIKIS